MRSDLVRFAVGRPEHWEQALKYDELCLLESSANTDQWPLRIRICIGTGRYRNNMFE